MYNMHHNRSSESKYLYSPWWQPWTDAITVCRQWWIVRLTVMSILSTVSLFWYKASNQFIWTDCNVLIINFKTSCILLCSVLLSTFTIKISLHKIISSLFSLKLSDLDYPLSCHLAVISKQTHIYEWQAIQRWDFWILF